MRYFGKVCAFILFIIAMKFFNDGNMYWWLFMFAFIIVSGFLIGEENIEDEQVEAMLKPRWYDNAHCMECGYVNKACVCKPVSGRWEIKQTGNDFTVINEENKELPKDWEEYKATYDDSGHDDYIDTAMTNRDADIMHNDGLSEWEATKSEEAEAADERLRNEMKILNVTDWNHVTDGDVEDFDDEGNPINTVY